MKYFSLETVERAYKLISQQTNNKFWGILAITSSVNRIVESATVYNLNITNVSTLLENQFSLVEHPKEYNKSYTWNVIFSKKWANYIADKLLHVSPNVYAVLVW
jgi:hypothetical protein